METVKTQTASPIEEKGAAQAGSETAGNALSKGCSLLCGKILLAYLRVRHRALVHRVMALAVHLEDDIFPALRSREERWLCLEVRETDFTIGVCDDGDGRFAEFPGLTAVGEKLLELGVRQLRLDTALEFGQIVDGFVILLHAGPALTRVKARDEVVTSWRREAAAAAMKGENGYHRFCSRMSYDADRRRFEVEYTYCELFFQRMVKSTVQRSAKYGDHRFLFALAPRATLGLLLLVVGLWLTILKSAVLSTVLLGGFGVLAAVVVGQLIRGVGAQHYTQEHLNLLVQNHVKTIKLQLGEIRQSYDRLSRLEQLRDDLVHMVVHDMKNPLIGMISELEYLEELTEGALGDEERECLVEAASGAQRLFEMVRSLLDVSRLEQGKMPLNLQQGNLAQIAREAVTMLGSMARDHQLTVKGQERVDVQCDHDTVRRIIANLAGNALKYTPRGQDVSIQVDAVAPGGKVEVHDCGPGIPEAMRQHIFEKFGQVEDKNDHTLYSTGLGLTFCKLAVEAHGGEIGVDSVVGEGSRFWFTLPTAPQTMPT